MKLALIQTNPTIGDIDRNVTKIRARLDEARAAGATLAIFPEQAIIGYPAKDLLLRTELIQANLAALELLASECTDIAAIVGFAQPNDKPFGRPLFNAAAVLAEGRVQQVIRKRLLPTYDVFDEARYFEPGDHQAVVTVAGRALGLSICEDLWSREELLARPLYNIDPIRDLVDQGAELVVNISASPYFLGKQDMRRTLLADHARRHRRPLIFVNQVGGNDELLFDGASCVVDADGQVVAQARAFDEDLLLFDTQRGTAARSETLPKRPGIVCDALVMGLRDYVRKCGFQQVVLGLSGGIDSALVAVLAARALGPDNVLGIAMPSRYSSDHSVADARRLAHNLGIRLHEIPIEPMHAAFEETLQPHFGDRPPDVTEENIQARVRGGVLMALSNKLGSLLLTTGNKSELAVGYCTLYGDMCGGLAVISDVPKTLVYDVARWINSSSAREVVPESTIAKPPSAELRPDQRDQDSLPDYAVLDEILLRYEEQLQSVPEIVAAGFERNLVERVVRMIHLSEYKRQQAAPGLKVTSRAFGFGRRMPIAARAAIAAGTGGIGAKGNE